MVPVIFMVFGDQIGGGFKVTIWWQQATKRDHLSWGEFTPLDIMS